MVGGIDMIIDWYYPAESDNFGQPNLYLRTRDKEGTLHEETYGLKTKVCETTLLDSGEHT